MKSYFRIAFAFCFILFGTLLNAQYKIGDVATDFKLKNIDNSYVSLADFESAKG